MPSNSALESDPPGGQPPETPWPRFRRRGVWADTAMFGLPPLEAVAAGRAAVEAWMEGAAGVDAWQGAVERARGSLARLHGAHAADVALAATVSSLVACVASAVPVGATVVVTDDEFLSVAYPFETIAAGGHLSVVRARRSGLAAAVARHRPAWVAASLVRSRDGDVLDAAALRTAADRAGTRVLLDVSQAGWMRVPLDTADVLVGAGHKWLMGPHGTAFLIAAPAVRASLAPVNAGWTSRADGARPPWGPQARHADGRRLDQSPAYLNWVVQAAALAVVERLGLDRIGRHALGLAAGLADHLDLPQPASPILALRERPGDLERLAAAGIRVTRREGDLRVSLHLHNTEGDVDRIAEVLST